VTVFEQGCGFETLNIAENPYWQFQSRIEALKVKSIDDMNVQAINVTEAECEPALQPHGIGDDLRWKATSWAGG
jgi:hypothetical protein